MNFNLPPKNMRFFAWGSAMFLLFLLFLFFETKGLFVSLDPKVTIFSQALLPRTFDTWLSLFSLLGNIEPTSLLVLALGLWIFLREKRIFYPLILFGVIAVFEFIGKFFLYHPGPPQEFFRFNLPFEFPHLYIKTASSFPSGHVSRTMFLVIIGLFLVSKYIKSNNQKLLVSCFFFLFSLLMIVSRVYLGEHWTSDVLGGLLLGSSMALFVMVYY